MHAWRFRIKHPIVKAFLFLRMYVQNFALFNYLFNLGNPVTFSLALIENHTKYEAKNPHRLSS